MKIRKIVFLWQQIGVDVIDKGNIIELKIVFDELKDNPTVFIDTGNLKVEDNTIKVDVKEILKKISELDFEIGSKYFVRNDFINGSWKLIVNDMVYDGAMQEPEYVKKIKRIIRYEVFLDYANKKIAAYLK